MLTKLDRLLFVRGVPLFKELRDDFLIRLATVMDELVFPPQHTIFRKGEKGQSLYILVSGRVKVHIGDRTLVELPQGSCFGEMAVFDAEPRSASITTLEPCECLLLTQQQLYEAVDEMPGIAVNLIRLLSRRIRDINQAVNEAAQGTSRPAEQAASEDASPYPANGNGVQGNGHRSSRSSEVLPPRSTLFQ